jgi:ABC-2 type transport system permease protein
VSKIWLIAKREFSATVFTKAFIIGLMILPTMIGIGVLFGPRLFMDRAFAVAGEVAIIDPTGEVVGELRAALTEGTTSANVAGMLRLARRAQAVDDADVLEALGAAPKLTIVELPPQADVEREKAWLWAPKGDAPHLALVVIDVDVIAPAPGATTLGAYALYVPPRQDLRVEVAVHQSLREAIVAARVRERGLDHALINELVTVPRVRSVTVSDDAERGGGGALNIALPFAFMFLLIMGVMTSGQGMLTTTVEEKSSRVVEVLLSALSPMQLMAGKLLGHMGVSLVAMIFYLGLGLVVLATFSLLGLLDISLIFYLFVFFVIGFLTIGSLMMAAGAAVNDMREAQTLMMPLMMVMIAPWALSFPISRNPDSTLAYVVSFVPPLNSFGMLLRLASTSPPPAWQVWLSIGIGVLGVVSALWFAAKVFRIGLLMFGKPPNFATLVRWVRAA